MTGDIGNQTWKQSEADIGDDASSGCWHMFERVVGGFLW